MGPRPRRGRRSEAPCPGDSAGARLRTRARSGCRAPPTPGSPRGGAGEPGDRAPARSQPPAAVLVLVQGEVGEAVLEVQRRPEPERRGAWRRPVRLQRGADRAMPQGAVAGASDLGGSTRISCPSTVTVPSHVPHWVRRVWSMMSMPSAGRAGLAGLLDGHRGGPEGEVDCRPTRPVGAAGGPMSCSVPIRRRHRRGTGPPAGPGPGCCSRP